MSRLFSLMLIRTAGLPANLLEALSSFSGYENDLEKAHLALQETNFALTTELETLLQQLPEGSLRTGVYNLRQAFFQNPALKPEKGNLLRDCPRAFALWAQRTALRDQIAALHTAHSTNYDASLRQNIETLKTWTYKAPLERSLLFSSHELLKRLDSFRITGEALNKKNRQRALAIAQYATRAIAKTSPFSHFTTVSLVNLDADAPDLPDFFAKSAVTPNVGLLPYLYDALLKEPAFYRSLKIRLNPTITTVPEPGDTITWLYFNGAAESFQQTETDELIVLVVRMLIQHDRQIPFQLLGDLLANEIEASLPELEQFLFDLIDTGLLEWQWPEAGFSPSWCDGLYQYLGFLPPSACTIEAASLLQWLRTAGRTLQFVTTDDAIAAQQNASREVNQFLEKYGVPPPNLPLEQVFYEDVDDVVQPLAPETAVAQIAAELAQYWLENARQSNAQRALYQHYETFYAQQQAVDFVEFARSAIQQAGWPHLLAGNLPPVKNTWKGKIGALVQFYQENGEWFGVVNGLYPGGGKMFARWMHLFPENATAKLTNWAAGNYRFPWQGWNNVNFQPARFGPNVAVPGARAHTGEDVLAGNLVVKANNHQLGLYVKATGQPVTILDLGLEAPFERPPVLRLLAVLGQPFVSLEALLPPTLPLAKEEPWRQVPRFAVKHLVLRRETWLIQSFFYQNWLTATGISGFEALRRHLSEIGVPTRFFASWGAGKPQYFDQNSPVLMLLFEKMIRQSDGLLRCTEWLPHTANAVKKEGQTHVSEFVLEIDLSE